MFERTDHSDLPNPRQESRVRSVSGRLYCPAVAMVSGLAEGGSPVQRIYGGKRNKKEGREVRRVPLRASLRRDETGWVNPVPFSMTRTRLRIHCKLIKWPTRRPKHITELIRDSPLSHHTISGVDPPPEEDAFHIPRLGNIYSFLASRANALLLLAFQSVSPHLTAGGCTHVDH